MGSHFIHFNLRTIRLRFPRDPDDPWFSEYQPPSAGFERPRFHVTQAIHGPAERVKPGDTIWLVGQLSSTWGRLRPALDARIDVDRCRKRTRGRGFRYTAAASPRWFPLADLTPVLSRLKTVTATKVTGPLTGNPDQPVGQALRRMRELDSGALLRDWERGLDSKDYHFVSYRLCDGTLPAFEKVKALMAEEVPVFWDRWSLPRRLAERRERLGDRPLDSTIKASIRGAAVVWGIESPRYADERSYAARECRLAVKLGTYRSVSVA